MAYFPNGLPGPMPDEVTSGFWDNCNQRRLCFQTCQDCGWRSHPPMSVCPKCQSQRLGWTEAPSRGRIFSLVWAYNTAHPSLRGMKLPYNVAVVEFPDLPGVRLISNVVDGEVDDLRIGDAVELAWEEVEEFCLPRCRKRQ